jgi:hypothetical protein
MSIRRTLAILCFVFSLQMFAGASTYTTFNMPGSCSAFGNAMGINKWGSVTGYYAPCGGGDVQGFLCRCSKIMSPHNCNEILSPSQDGDHESERVPAGESD